MLLCVHSHASNIFWVYEVDGNTYMQCMMSSYSADVWTTRAEKDSQEKKSLLQHEDDMPVPTGVRGPCPLMTCISESEVTTASKMTIRIWIFNEGTREGSLQGGKEGLGYERSNVKTLRTKLFKGKLQAWNYAHKSECLCLCVHNSCTGVHWK